MKGQSIILATHDEGEAHRAVEILASAEIPATLARSEEPWKPTPAAVESALYLVMVPTAKDAAARAALDG
jgi:hypothetical protein